MKHIDSDECHNILLSLAFVFDEICKRHQIPYFMLNGTMLGAVRHQGFIPWDDDMDFGVERKYFPELIKALSEELPAYLKVNTLENSDYVFSNFLKIEDTRTEVVEHWYDNARGIGIWIDIFPLDHGCANYWLTTLFAACIFCLLMIKDYLYYDPKFRKGFKKWIAIIVCKINLISIKKRLRYIDKLISRHTKEKSGYLVNYYGRLRKKGIIPKKIFGSPKAYPFENLILTGVEHADTYLSALYGNYMQMPTKDKQAKHTLGMYYKSVIQQEQE